MTLKMLYKIHSSMRLNETNQYSAHLPKHKVDKLLCVCNVLNFKIST